MPRRVSAKCAFCGFRFEISPSGGVWDLSGGISLTSFSPRNVRCAERSRRPIRTGAPAPPAFCASLLSDIRAVPAAAGDIQAERAKTICAEPASPRDGRSTGPDPSAPMKDCSWRRLRGSSFGGCRIWPTHWAPSSLSLRTLNSRSGNSNSSFPCPFIRKGCAFGVIINLCSWRDASAGTGPYL